MIRRKRASASSLFLLELMISILFFALASAVCVRIFVHAHLISEQARLLNQAVNRVSATAEVLNAAEDEADLYRLLELAYPCAEIDSETVIVPLDENFDPVETPQDASNLLMLTLRTEEGMAVADLSAGTAGEEPIYQLHVEHYMCGFRAEEQGRDAYGS